MIAIPVLAIASMAIGLGFLTVVATVALLGTIAPMVVRAVRGSLLRRGERAEIKAGGNAR